MTGIGSPGVAQQVLVRATNGSLYSGNLTLTYNLQGNTYTRNFGMPYNNPVPVLMDVTGLGEGNSVSVQLLGDSTTSATSTVGLTRTINSNGPGSADFGVCNADLRYHLQVSSQPSGQTCVTRYGAGFVGDSFYPRRLV
ncbi:MAG: hypothetical protein EBU92_14655, partial [Betaproteobacteria bacterium]|nr:hypothetical protein [Betaproteobacteria bacterium]